MQAIPRSTIALSSLLLISARSTGGQEVKSPQPEKSKPPVKMEQRGRILGIGGVFFKSANRDQMREWYSKHLGLADKIHGAMLPWRENDNPQKEHATLLHVSPPSPKIIAPRPPHAGTVCPCRFRAAHQPECGPARQSVRSSGHCGSCSVRLPPAAPREGIRVPNKLIADPHSLSWWAIAAPWRGSAKASA